MPLKFAPCSFNHFSTLQHIQDTDLNTMNRSADSPALSLSIFFQLLFTAQHRSPDHNSHSIPDASLCHRSFRAIHRSNSLLLHPLRNPSHRGSHCSLQLRRILDGIPRRNLCHHLHPELANPHLHRHGNLVALDYSEPRPRPRHTHGGYGHSSQPAASARTSTTWAPRDGKIWSVQCCRGISGIGSARWSGRTAL